MAIAAFKLYKCTGSGPTRTDSNKHPNFLSSDVHSDTPSLYTIAVPLQIADSPNYSYECVLQWECTIAPDNQVTAMRVYGPNVQPDNPTNKLTVLWGVVDTLSYTAPVDTASTKATTRQDTNYFSNTDSPKENLDLTVEPSDGKINAVGERTDYLYTQLKVELGAASGDMTTQIYTLRYTES